MSYAVYMTFKSEPPSTNACRYATAKEAERAGDELLSRWTYPTGYEVRESADPVNCEFPEDAARPQRLKEGP